MSTTAAEGRTLVKTQSAGWYKDLADPDGPNVRKKDGDTILGDQPTNGASAEAPAPAAETETETDAERKARLKKIGQDANGDKPEPVKTELSSGKVAIGRTVTIKCAWVDPDNRTKAQQRLFAGPTKTITYDKVVKAAGDDQAAQPCGTERVIKAQDEFQVRFCPAHTKLRRNELRRIQNAARAQTAKAAGTKS